MRKFVYLGSTTSYNQYFRKNSFKDDYQILYSSTPEESLKGFLWLLYKAHNSETIDRYIHLPFKEVWAKYIIDKKTKALIEKEDDICFVFSDIGYRYNRNSVLPYLKKQYPNCYTAYYFNDIIEYYNKRIPGFSVSEFSALYDFVFTYNKNDAERYSIPVPPPRIRDYSNVPDDNSLPECDLFFVGKNRGRLPLLQQIYDCCSAAGLTCEFFVTEVDPEDISAKYPFNYNQFISYDEVLRRVKRSKAVINLIQEGAKGITLRDYEAIGMNKLLVTDGEAICDTELYTPAKVILVKNLEWELHKFHESESHSWNGTEYYSEEALYAWYNNYIDTHRRELKS